MKKLRIIGVIVLVVAVAFLGMILLLRQEATNVQPEQQTSQGNTQTTEETPVAELLKGRYTDYDAEKIAEAGYNDTVLFFYASWCPECRAFEQAIEASELPEGIQILKVDYDTATDLRKKYEVTLQSSFVSVTDNGDKITYWQGYGKDKSVEAILENT